MADTSKLGTILILAVICVGVALVVSSGISAWQTYQNIAGDEDTTGPSVPQPTITVAESPVPATAVPETPAIPVATVTCVTPTAVQSVSAPAVPETPAIPVVTVTYVTPTAVQSVAAPASTSSPSAPTLTPAVTPFAAPAADDPVLGTWTGTKSVSMFFVSANGQGTVTFRDDYTGDLSGEFHGAGMDEVFASGFVWTNNGGGSYTGSIGTESMGFTLAGETLTMTINPKKLGLNALLDMDIPVEMHRV